MPKYKAVLFDFDGTLYDTSRGITRTYQKVLTERYGLGPFSDEQLRLGIGPPLVEVFENLYHIPHDECMHAAEAYIAAYGEFSLQYTEMYPGVKDALCRLYEGGVKLGIATSKNIPEVKRVLSRDGITDLFSAFGGPASVKDSANKALSINKALAQLDLQYETQSVLMVGDRCYDAEGAQNTALDFCAVTYAGFGEPGEFDPFPCVLRTKNPRDIADYVLGAASAGTVLYCEKGGELYFVLVTEKAGHTGLPKGHIERGETALQAALRETVEETGITAEPLPDFELKTEYTTPNGIEKTVSYYLARFDAATQHPADTDEVAAVRLLPEREALAAATHDSTRELLRAAAEHIRAEKR